MRDNTLYSTNFKKDYNIFKMKAVWNVYLITIMVWISKVRAIDYCTRNDAQDKNGPQISPCLNEIVLEKGQNFTIHCKGKKHVQFKQQNIEEEGLGNTFVKKIRNVTSVDTQYPYETALDLYNVDQYAVGYYACYDDTINETRILNNLMEEPPNTEHVTYIYIYVNGTDNLLVPMGEVVQTRDKRRVVLGCRPTSPDVQVTLKVRSNKTAEYLKFSPKIGFLVRACRPPYQCYGQRGNDTVKKPLRCQNIPVDTPKIQGTDYFLEGETFSLNCTVAYQRNLPVELKWDIPRKVGKDFVNQTTNECDATEVNVLYNTITIVNATKDDHGLYNCTSSNNSDKKTRRFLKKFIESPFINLRKITAEVDGIVVTRLYQKRMRLQINISGHPYPKYYFLRNGLNLPSNASKYYIDNMPLSGETVLNILDLNVKDTANYTLYTDNRYVKKNVTFDLRVSAVPVVEFFPKTKTTVVGNKDQYLTLMCEVTGYPLPFVNWYLTANGTDHKLPTSDFTTQSVYKATSHVDVPVKISGNITCKATNIHRSDQASKQLLVDEIQGGFGIMESETWYPENHNVTLKCVASKYNYSNLTWIDSTNGGSLNDFVKYSESPFSHEAILKIIAVPLTRTGSYTCVGYKNDGHEESESISITIEANQDTIIYEPEMDQDEEVSNYQYVQFSCVAEAVPPPEIKWRKDGVLLENGTDGDVTIVSYCTNNTLVNSTVIIPRMKEEYKGKYECIATNMYSEEVKVINLLLEDKSPYTTTYLSIIGAVFIILIIIVIYLTWKIRREKRFRKELAAAGLLYFKEGVPNSLNPDLVVDDQAELLPYDDRFEFPSEKLFLGKQLGAGAFGVVYKADARGIINAEETTPVAVKMVKKTADNMYIKALASELKIMVHLGKHINIVNLLGACTKNVGKRELIVIVEYCKFGNIHNYMQKHRDVFIDQLTDNTEKNLGKINRGYSCSSASSGMHSDYFGSNNTQATDHTFLNTANTTKSGRKVSEGHVQPEWRSNYETDYVYDTRNPRPLSSRDLLAWAFQIARGMEYLASRKVLHGDLAARNILLADDNIVKICDFGLARSIYKNDEYQKKENSPLPVKWLAIECMTDRIFSTQSDVWSFGIVLWELFSLAKTPYPNMSPQNLLQWLTDGRRLEKPTYADDRLYDVMRQCWEHKPTMRPSFTRLQELLGSFLEDNVRNHYVDLNSSCMDTNAKNEPQEDYLAMMNSPDYNNIVTPSPHHYVNEVRSFFPPSPTEIPHDEEGYLQMTPANKMPFSPRPQNTQFDFDARKMNNRATEASNCGSELTPMLTLNNLPRSGSESDHEGNHSPYLNMCPRIEEETDEVFLDTKSQNIKNIQNSAVTNPTYITFGMDIEKKSQDINNSYINIPNGLVK
ncbi:vascular endothelial growth factor receptor 1 isoform X2 [Achroia grisella]|uniref:vascular endothelial growth factor receptor 1 isoform X2 n=1 Tax=Achroia grisella TaxID=688607 RepID=UPI0027D35006|nr:vascular endothelial growth factor receptor 1 isoform X2 [Achroia grisella]